MDQITDRRSDLSMDLQRDYINNALLDLKKQTCAMLRCLYLLAGSSQRNEGTNVWKEQALAILKDRTREYATESMFDTSIRSSKWNENVCSRSTILTNRGVNFYAHDWLGLSKIKLQKALCPNKIDFHTSEDLNVKLSNTHGEPRDFDFDRDRNRRAPVTTISPLTISSLLHSRVGKEFVVPANLSISRGPLTRSICVCVLDQPEMAGEALKTEWPVLKIVVARYGSVKCFRTVLEKWPYLVTKLFVETVAVEGNIELLEEIHSSTRDLFTCKTMQKAVESMRLEVVDFLLDVDCPTEGATAVASLCDNMEALKLLERRGCQLTQVGMNNAAGEGNLEMLKRFAEKGFRPNRKTMECACRSTSLDSFSYLCELGGVVEPCILKACCRTYNLDVAMYCLLTSSKEIVTDCVVNAAAKSSSPVILVAMHMVKNLTIKDMHFELAAMYGNVPHLIFMNLVSHRFPKLNLVQATRRGIVLISLNPEPTFGSKAEENFVKSNVPVVKLVNCLRWLGKLGADPMCDAPQSDSAPEALILDEKNAYEVKEEEEEVVEHKKKLNQLKTEMPTTTTTKEDEDIPSSSEFLVYTELNPSTPSTSSLRPIASTLREPSTQ